MVGSRQWRTEGQRRRFAPGGTLRRAAKKEKEKRKNGKKEKGRKREKENMEEACNYSKTKMEHLSCGALTHNLAKLALLSILAQTRG